MRSLFVVAGSAGRRRARPWPALPLLVCTAVACSSPAEPPPTPVATLLIVNGTCTAAGCGIVHVLGFPAANQPATPGGPWSLDLGTTDSREICLTIPASATFRVIGQTSAGTSDTLTTTWTSALPLALGLVPPGVSRLQASPTTSLFVPARARGWRITLPGDSSPAPAEACGT